MRVRSRTTDRITPAGRRFFAQVGRLKREPYVKVGVVQKKFSQPKVGEGTAPLTLGEVAVVNEFGSQRKRANGKPWVPERSFIRSTHDDIKNDVSNILKRRKLEVVAGIISARAALSLVAVYVQGKIQNKIIMLRTPPNEESTVARKKSDNPLIDEGQLLRSISWEYHGSD